MGPSLSSTSELGNQNGSMNEERRQGSLTVSLPTTPELAEAMREVYRTGGFPLAALFIAALLGILAVGLDVLGGAVQFISNVSILLVYLGVFTFLVLTIIAYLRWKAELNRNLQTFKAETELQDKFVLQVIEYASRGASGDLTPKQRMDEIESLTRAIAQLVSEVTKARAQLRAITPTSVEPVTTNSRNNKAS